MATSTIGSNPACNNWLFDAAMHQAWIGSYSISDAVGRMIQVNATFAAFSGGGAGGAVAWLDSGSSASLYTNTGNIPAGNQGSGCSGSTNRSSSGDVPFASSDNWQFGFYCANGVFTNYHTDAGNSFVKASAISAPTGGTNYSAYGSGGGSQIAFGTFFIIEMYVRTSIWNKTLGYVDTADGNHWSAADTYVYTTPGGGLTQVGELVKQRRIWDEVEKYAYLPNGERVLLRWDYETPRYMGFGYPGDPALENCKCLSCQERRLLAA
jgi:hypothetical protein